MTITNNTDEEVKLVYKQSVAPITIPPNGNIEITGFAEARIRDSKDFYRATHDGTIAATD